MQQSKGWSKIWILEVPHTVKIFLWRFCCNNIPIRNLLQGKGLSNPIGCAMCVGEIEHLLHLFFDYRFTKDCLHYVGIEYDMWETENASGWLLDRLSNETTTDLQKTACIMRIEILISNL